MAKNTALAPPALTAAELREALAEDREAQRLRSQITELEAKGVEDREAYYAEEDRLIAEQEAGEQTALAEKERRIREEKLGSLMYAARQAVDRGVGYIPPDLFDGLSPDALSELKNNPLYGELWHASLAAYGEQAMRARMS